MENQKCIKCNNSMEAGFCLDGNIGGTVPLRWYPGSPENGETVFGVNIKTDTLNSRSIETEKIISITTYRCTNCGYLENYAIKK